MKIPFCLSVVCSVLSLAYGAMAETPDTEQSPFACAAELPAARRAELLTAIERRYSSIDSMRADFVQDSYLSSIDESQLSQGQMTFLKPGRMRWEYRSPERQTFIIRDKDVWLYQHDLNQIVVEQLEQVVLSDVPVAFLLGLGKLENRFRVERACENRDGIVVILAQAAKAPQDNSLGRIALLVDRNDFTPHGARVVDVASNFTAIVFSNIKVNPSGIKEAEFDTSFPPGADVSDRRLGSLAEKDLRIAQ